VSFRLKDVSSVSIRLMDVSGVSFRLMDAPGVSVWLMDVSGVSFGSGSALYRRGPDSAPGSRDPGVTVEGG